MSQKIWKVQYGRTHEFSLSSLAHGRFFTMQTETVSWYASSCDASPSPWQVSSYPTSGSLQPSTLVGQWVLFGVYDGHGGDRASGYCRDHLLSTIASFAARPPDGDPITAANMSEALRLGFLKTDQVIDLTSRRVRGSYRPFTCLGSALCWILLRGRYHHRRYVWTSSRP
jgi:hypothetical protein